MCDDEYNPTILADRIEWYGPQGLPPVYINDRFKDHRYEILNKLHHTPNATVWMAKDHQFDELVTLKIISANKSKDNQELSILKHLHNESNSSDHPGRKHIVRLHDDFFFESPNGTHLCLVTKYVGPDLYSVRCVLKPECRLDKAPARKFARQILLAVDFLHSCGVVHGDLNDTNVLFQQPHLRNDVLNLVHQGPVTRRDGKPLAEGIPNYLVDSMELSDRLTRQDIDGISDIQIIDFGSAFFVSDPPESIDTPIDVAPPEVIFGRPLSLAVDIWNLACVTYYAAIGESLFAAMNDDRDLVPQILGCIGEQSAHYLLSSLIKAIGEEVWTDLPSPAAYDIEDCPFRSLEDVSRELYYPKNIQVGNKGNENDQEGDNMSDESYLKILINYLRKMLVADPTGRTTTRALLREDFVEDTTLGKVEGSVVTRKTHPEDTLAKDARDP